jgi:dipeptidyl aminopeptidase/acylaminoacyl peptidase
MKGGPVRVLALSILAAVLVGSSAAAQEVTVARGNIYFRATSGAPLQPITTSGLDSDAALSPDHQWIAFVRSTPGRIVFSGAGDVEATELWVAKSDGTHTRRLVSGRDSHKTETLLGGLAHPEFAPTGSQIYFQSAAWAASLAVHAVTLDGAERFVCPGTLHEVVPAGRYAGDLVVTQHRDFLVGGSYDWVWLVNPSGHEVGPIGVDTGDINSMRDLLRELYGAPYTPIAPR